MSGDLSQTLALQRQMSSGWTFAKPLVESRLYRRFHAMAVSSSSRVYIFGGETKVKNTNAGINNVTSVKRMLDDLICYDKATNEWQILHNGGGGPSCPSRRKGCTLTIYADRSLFLFGGAGPGTTKNDFWEFDIEARVWIDRTRDIVCQLFKEKRISHMEDDPLKMTWTPELTCKVGQNLAEDYPQLYPAPRAYHSAVEHDGRIIIYGGHGVKDQASALWVYEINRQDWRRVPLVGISKVLYPSDEGTTHPGIRFGVTSCVYGDGLYIFGGQQNSKLVGVSLWRLSLSSFQWQKVVTTGTPPLPQTYAAAALFGNRLIIHGGSSAEDVYAETHELNLDSFHWFPCPSMNTVVTLEGHTSAFLTSTFGLSTLTLFGGATKGPQIPESPVLELSITLGDSSVLRRMENLKVEDFVIRPASAAKLLWDLSRTRAELSSELEKIMQEKIQGREFSEKCLREALAQCRDITAKHSDLSEEMERVLADKKVMEEKYSQLLREKYQYESIISDYKERRGLLEQRIDELTRNERTLLSKHTDVSDKYGAFLNLMPAVAKAVKYAQVVTQPYGSTMDLEVNERQDKLAEVQRLSVNALKLIKEALSNHNLPIDIPESFVEMDTGQLPMLNDSAAHNRVISNLKSKESLPTSLPSSIPNNEEEPSETNEPSLKPRTSKMMPAETTAPSEPQMESTTHNKAVQDNTDNSSSSLQMERKRKPAKQGRALVNANTDGGSSHTIVVPSIGRKFISHPKKSGATTLTVSIDKAAPKIDMSNLRSSPIKKNNTPRGSVKHDREAVEELCGQSKLFGSISEEIKVGPSRSSLQSGSGILSSPPHAPTGHVNQQQIFSSISSNNMSRNSRSLESDNSSQVAAYSPKTGNAEGGYIVEQSNIGVTRGVCSYSSTDLDSGYGKLDIMPSPQHKLGSNRRNNIISNSAQRSREGKTMGNSTALSISMGINRATQCGQGLLKLFPSSNGSVQNSRDNNTLKSSDLDMSITKGIAAGDSSPLRLVS